MAYPLKYTDERQMQAELMYKAGLSINRISKRVGISPPTLITAFRELGWDTSVGRARTEKKKAVKKRLAEELKRKKDTGKMMPLYDIAKEFGMSAWGFSKIARRAAPELMKKWRSAIRSGKRK